MPEPISRREFLHVTAAAGAIGSLGFAPGVEQARANQGPITPAIVPADAGWFDRPMRWVQLTLVENDPGRFDPRFWLDYFRRLHSDAATLSAGSGMMCHSNSSRPSTDCAAVVLWSGVPSGMLFRQISAPLK